MALTEYEATKTGSFDVDRAPGDGSSTRSDSPPVRSSASGSAAKPGRKPQRWDRYILYNIAIPILLLVLGAAVITVFGEAGATAVPPPEATPTAALKSLPEVRVQKVRSLAETGKQLELVIDGTVVPFREALVSSEVAGQVIFKGDDCEAGAIVSKGQVLMRIDPTDYELDVERLTRQREEAYRALGEVDQEMANTRRSIEVAQKDVQLQEKEVERFSRLKQYASQSELDRARSTLLQASQQLINLENQLELLKSRRSRLEASEQLAATQLRSAELNLSRCEIKAPISGVIVSEEVDVNTFVSRGTQLLTIEDTSRVEVASSMRMDQLQWVLDQDQSLDRAGYDLPDTPAIIEYEIAGRESSMRRWSGTLVSYDGIGIDPNTRTVPVRVVVDDPMTFVDADGNIKRGDRTRALVRGMFVRVRLQLTPTTDLVVIPARALRPGNRVWMFQPEQAVLQQRLEELKRKRQEAASQSEPPVSSSDEAPEERIGREKFDPDRWVAGRVKATSSVYPIESLRLSGTAEVDPDVAPSLQVAGRDWICEAGRTDLAGGSYVVTSPLDAIPPRGLPARIRTEP